VQTTNLAEVRLLNNYPLPNDLKSPVVVIGNSYVRDFWPQLVKEMNILTNTWFFDHQTTEVFGDFLRQSELLDHCRVVVWITTEQHLAHFKTVPAPIMAAAPNAR
jgi:hypothetical protein